MILYDQNYNFIGISNETLSYLGYEDIADFTSQHSDFANLLVNKEGYIYKFQNFSWIDFILYSGSPNKSALLKLKSGEELEINLSVKEVHLTQPLNENSKFYAVRIISDNFVNIASKTDASITKKSPPKNNFNLGSLIQEEPAHTAEEIPAVPDIQTQELSAPTNSDFVLDFPTKEEIIQEESAIAHIDLTREKEDALSLSMPEEQAKSEEAFSLNLSETILDTPQEEENSLQKSDFILQKQEESEDFTLNFLKDTSETEAGEEPIQQTEIKAVKEDVSLDFLKVDMPEETDAGFRLKHAKEEEKIESPAAEKEEISLNFLQKREEISKEEVPQEEIFPKAFKEELALEETPLFTLPDTPQEEETLPLINEEEIDATSIRQKEQIIAQIKNDIDEIDAPQEALKSQEIEENFSLGELNATLFNKNEVKKEKKSFTKTLKSLFAENTLEIQNDDDTEQSYVEVYQEPDAVLKKEAPDTPSQVNRFPTLSSLGLDKEEEDDLISEFVHDTQSDIRLLKEFIHSNNLSQAEYLLVKMLSSADILNLNDIIHTLSDIKQSCAENASDGIEALIAKLETQVGTLASYLERETV